MRGVTYDRYGRPDEVLKVADRADVAPKDGELLIAVGMVPIHPGDLLGVEGRYRKSGDVRDPEPGTARPGFEGMGVVLAVGPKVEGHLIPGTRVAFFPTLGAWAEQVVVDAGNVTVLPDDIDDAIGAQLLINPITAAMLIREVTEYGVGSGDKVVFSAAGSAVAKLAMRIASERGIEPIGVIRSASGVEALRAEFPDLFVVSTDSQDWGERLTKEAGSRGIRAAVDPVGGQIAGELLARLGEGGHFISYGDLSGDPIPVPPLALPTRGLTMSGVNVGSWSKLPPDVRRDDVETAIGLARHSKGLFPVAAAIDIEDVRSAARMVGEPGRHGAVLLSISGRKE